VIFLDANLLIYAVDSDAPHHLHVRQWLEDTLSGDARVGLAWVVLLAFLRVTTRERILVRPLAPGDAMNYVTGWLAQPNVEPISPGPNHWPVLRSLLQASGMAGNLTTDAHLAAMAIEHGAALYSTDNDFRRFSGLEHVNPLTAR
jgi:toxin-antitoxin system PIN domain toxin